MREFGRRGYTIIELLTGIVLFAALSAVVVPSVVVQIEKSEVMGVVKQLESLRLAIETFHADLHGDRWPSNVPQLIYSDYTRWGTTDDLQGQPINSGLRKSWKGPYLSKGYVPESGVTIPLQGVIENDFAIECVNRSPYLTVKVSGLTELDANKVMKAMAEGMTEWDNDSAELVFRAVPMGTPKCH